MPSLGQKISKIPLVNLKTFTIESSLKSFMRELLGGVDSSLGAGSQQTQKLNQFPPMHYASDFHETLQGRSAGEYLKIHRMGFLTSTVKVKIWQIFII